MLSAHAAVHLNLLSVNASQAAGLHCLPGLTIPAKNIEDICSDGPSSLSRACIDQFGGAHCLAWAAMTLPLYNSDRMCKNYDKLMEPQTARLCDRNLVGKHRLFNLLSGRTIVFAGDSLMRQLFLRIIALFRGQETVVDFAFHNDALYILDGVEDAFVPLLLEFRAPCALQLAQGNMDAKCTAAINKASPPISSNGALTSTGALKRWIQTAMSRRWTRPRATLIYLFEKDYAPDRAFGKVLLDLKPDIVVAGALGGHVPCWSNGQPGLKCSIEKVKEETHAQFWAQAKQTLQTLGTVEHLTWLTFPHGHIGARWQNGNYTRWNQRTVSEAKRLGESLHVPTTIIHYDRLARKGVLPLGVLAARADTTHFQCIFKGKYGFYPNYDLLQNAGRRVEMRLRRLLVVNASGRLTRVEDVSCAQPDCVPNGVNGCQDHMNTALATRWALALSRYRRLKNNEAANSTSLREAMHLQSI